MRRALYIAILVAATLAVMYLAWFGYLWHISMPVYHFTKQPHGHTLNMYQADKATVNVLIPNTQAYFIWSYGDTVVLQTDNRGFRINPESVNTDTTGGLLFFGDSFTLCEELPAPQGYPYLLGNALCQPVHNAAISAHGYAQMILRARLYIQQTNPEVVVFQVSPWLAERAVTPYMPAIFFKMPAPYYNQLGNIVPPYYYTPVLELTQNEMLQHYRESEVSLGDKLSFVWNFTHTVFGQEYWEEFKLWFKPKTPERTNLKDALQATELAINEMQELCKEKTLVFLVMGYEKDRIHEFEEKFGAVLSPNTIVVNADELLWSQPGINTKDDHERAYCFWHGEPPVLVDYHYNAHANQLIMEALIDTLQSINRCNTGE